MSITQTVDIPDSHRLVIEVPREIPTGPVILTFTPVVADNFDARIDDGSLAYLFRGYTDDGLREPIVDFGKAVGNEQW